MHGAIRPLNVEDEIAHIEDINGVDLVTVDFRYLREDIGAVGVEVVQLARHAGYDGVGNIAHADVLDLRHFAVEIFIPLEQSVVIPLHFGNLVRADANRVLPELVVVDGQRIRAGQQVLGINRELRQHIQECAIGGGELDGHDIVVDGHARQLFGLALSIGHGTLNVAERAGKDGVDDTGAQSSLEAEHHVVRSEGLAIVPHSVRAQRDVKLQVVVAHSHALCQVRFHVGEIRVGQEQRAEHVVLVQAAEILPHRVEQGLGCSADVERVGRVDPVDSAMAAPDKDRTSATVRSRASSFLMSGSLLTMNI